MANRLRTPLSERLRLDIPVFRRPANVTTVALAAAISKTGGLGGSGCAYMQPDAMRKRWRHSGP
jgi:NAD(P)H-dependent flavin oxidoreductase YrpB (nitropropane dioxygenase family)